MWIYQQFTNLNVCSISNKLYEWANPVNRVKSTISRRFDNVTSDPFPLPCSFTFCFPPSKSLRITNTWSCLELTDYGRDGLAVSSAIQFWICYFYVPLQLDYVGLPCSEGWFCTKEVQCTVSHHVQRQRKGVQLHSKGTSEHIGGVSSMACLPDNCSARLPISSIDSWSYLGDQQIFVCLGLLHWRSSKENEWSLWIYWILWSHHSFHIYCFAVAWSFLDRCILT